MATKKAAKKAASKTPTVRMPPVVVDNCASIRRQIEQVEDTIDTLIDIIKDPKTTNLVRGQAVTRVRQLRALLKALEKALTTCKKVKIGSLGGR